MSLATPLKLRRFQEALYTKAKQDPAYRFYLRYDKVYRADILAHAYALSQRHGGAADQSRSDWRDLMSDVIFLVVGGRLSLVVAPDRCPTWRE